MTREDAIKMLRLMEYKYLIRTGSIFDTALGMAIEALEGVCFDEWCDDCKEYDTEKKCCPRFNRVIRGAMKREPSEDGTLEVKVEDATKIGRVLISDDKHRGGLYYPDEYEPQGISFENDTKIKSCSKDSDLISRAEAIYEIHDFFFELMDKLPITVDEDGDEVITDAKTANTLLVYNQMLCKRFDALPSADRPTDGDLISRAEAIEAMGEEPPVWCDEEDEIAERNQWRADVEAIKSVPSAGRQEGKWIEHDGTWLCSYCGEEDAYAFGKNKKQYDYFCPNCGADMRAIERSEE